MKIAINRTNQNKMPDPLPPGWWAAFNGAFENEDCDAGDVLMFARYGWAYCAQVDGYRKVDRFICSQHLDLDFDDGRMDIYQLADDPFIARNASFLYETASSTAVHPKVRVFFELDRPIHDAQKYRLLRDALLARYPTADPAHRDACRFAFGSRDCNYIWLGNVLTLETAAAEIVRPYTAAQQPQEREKRPLNLSQPSQDGVSPRFLAGKLETLCNHLKNAPDGQKYYKLRSTAYALGGYVRQGYYDFEDVAQALHDAIDANPTTKSIEVADKCILSALNEGMKRPHKITGDQYKTLGQGAAAA